MGWMTCNPVFAERFERHAETNTQAPSGFSQVVTFVAVRMLRFKDHHKALVIQLITKHWGMEKFFRWLQGIQGEYTSRRDFLVDSIYELFDVLPATGERAALGAGLSVMTAYSKDSTTPKLSSEKYHTKTPLFSFIPPTAGMFIWVRFSRK